MFRPALKRLSVAAATAALVVPLVPAHAAGDQTRAGQAIRWQVGQLEQNRVVGAWGPDWGLTIDTALALASQGSRAKRLDRITNAIEKNYYDGYATFDGVVYANSMAKVLTASKVLGENPRDFGGRNVRRLVLGLVAGAEAGKERGRVRDSNHADGTDYSNTFGQALAVIGLARTGAAPRSTVDYLLRQQCDDGYFQLYPTAGRTCDASGGTPDVDATALAVQALVAARRDGKKLPAGTIRRAAAWLVSVQRDNGGFPGGAGTEGVNSNSTGLAAQALAAVGRDRAAAKAARYVARMQITERRAGNGPARAHVGAIAYDATSRRAAVRSGISDTSRDQFLRATAQGVFAFTKKSLATLKRP